MSVSVAAHTHCPGCSTFAVRSVTRVVTSTTSNIIVDMDAGASDSVSWSMSPPHHSSHPWLT